MHPARHWLAFPAAAALAVMPGIAAAQDCLTESEISAMAVYAMPGLVQGVKLRCAGHLAADGFVTRGGPALSARYVRLQPTVWPQAKSGLLKIAARKAAKASGDPAAKAGSGNADMMQMIASLPDTAVRPLVDALIVQEVAPEIDVKQCGKIELLMQALSGIDPAVAGTVLGLIAGLVKLEDPAICGAPA
jgi:hypothetical protein